MSIAQKIVKTIKSLIKIFPSFIIIFKEVYTIWTGKKWGK